MKNNKSILFVEDDKLDQIAFKRFVEAEKLPYDCTIADSVSSARGILAGKRFDIIITDYMLGDGTAFDILDLVENIPVIFVTGAGNEEVTIKAWKAGAYDYLVKDHDRNYLKTLPITVENALKYKQSEENIRLLSCAVMSTDDSVYITDAADKIIFVNKAFCENYGYEANEVIGKNPNMLYGNTAASAGGKNTFWHMRKNGTEFPASLVKSPIKDENKNEIAFVTVAHNVSEHIFTKNLVGTILNFTGNGREIS